MSLTLSRMREATALVRAIYERNPVGCCWHITLDDGNVDDDDVEFCATQASSDSDPYPDAPSRDPWPHEDCRALIRFMREASEEQRSMLSPGAHHPHGVEFTILGGFKDLA